MSTSQLQQLRPALVANKAKLTGTLDQIRQGFEEMLTESPVIEADGLREMATAYLGSTSPRNPSASPIHANLSGLPPLLIQVGSAEILLDDAMRLAARAGAAGVKVRLDIWPEMFHVWHVSASVLDEAREALDDAAAFLKSRLPNKT
jgi:acetyl esterase/lipase